MTSKRNGSWHSPVTKPRWLQATSKLDLYDPIFKNKPALDIQMHRGDYPK